MLSNPNGPPNMAEIGAVLARMRYRGVTELRLGNDWVGRWENTDELPRGVLVIEVYAAVYLGDKGYVFRPRGEDVWGTLSGRPEGDAKPLPFLKSLAKAGGITPGRIELIGYFDCKATSYNARYPAETAAVVPFYAVAAKAAKDVPADSPFERRRLPINEHMATLRQRYPEFETPFSDAADRYLVLRARGEV
ncbi:MAG: hypothetical protein HY875_07245 [Chloroflexi bacterium]|nr:hypothetical protein [Chloroflexota bacterium]